MGKSTISMAIFNSKLLHYQRVGFLRQNPPKDRNINLSEPGIAGWNSQKRNGTVGKLYTFAIIWILVMNIYIYVCIHVSVFHWIILYIFDSILCYILYCVIFNVHFFENYMAFNYIILCTTLCLICAVDCSHSQITLYFAIFNFKLYYIMLYDIIYIYIMEFCHTSSYGIVL